MNLLSPQSPVPTSRRESGMTGYSVRTGMSCFSGGSSVAQEKLQKAVRELRLQLKAQQDLQSQKIATEIQMDRISAENRLLKVKVDGLSHEIDTLRVQAASQEIESDSVEDLRQRLMDMAIQLKKSQIQGGQSGRQISDLQRALDEARMTILEFGKKVDIVEQAHREVRAEADAEALRAKASLFLYETMADVIRDIAMCIKIASLRKENGFAKHLITEWRENFDRESNELSVSGMMSLAIQAIVSELKPLIAPSKFHYDKTVKDILDAASEWAQTGNISRLSEFISSAENSYWDANSPMPTLTAERRVSALKPDEYVANSPLRGFLTPTFRTPQGDIDAVAAFDDATKLLTYFSGLFSSAGDHRIGSVEFPTEPFPVSPDMAPECQLFYEALNTFKAELKALLDTNGISLRETNFAGVLTQVIDDNHALRDENALLRFQLEQMKEREAQFVQGFDTLEKSTRERYQKEILDDPMLIYLSPERVSHSDEGSTSNWTSPFVPKMSGSNGDWYRTTFGWSGNIDTQSPDRLDHGQSTSLIAPWYPNLFGPLPDMSLKPSPDRHEDMRRRIESWRHRADQIRQLGATVTVSTLGSPPPSLTGSDAESMAEEPATPVVRKVNKVISPLTKRLMIKSVGSVVSSAQVTGLKQRSSGGGAQSLQIRESTGRSTMGGSNGFLVKKPSVVRTSSGMPGSSSKSWISSVSGKPLTRRGSVTSVMSQSASSLQRKDLNASKSAVRRPSSGVSKRGASIAAKSTVEEES